MKTETAWAIGIGIMFGLIIAFGLWRINLNIKVNKEQPKVDKTASPLTPEPLKNIKFKLDKPTDNLVVNKDLFTVEGIGNPNSKIIISTDTDDYITSSDQSGKFSKEIKLNSDINQILVEGVKSTIVYSSTFEELEATVSAQKLPTSYIGTVTDVTGSAIQIKSNKNEIMQITASEEVSVTNTRDTPNKIAKLTDVAIGDVIAGLGYTNSSQVLEASRILIINPMTELEVKVISTKYSKPELKTDKNTSYYEFVDGSQAVIKSTAVKADMDIIYVEKDDLVRTVFLLQDVLN